VAQLSSLTDTAQNVLAMYRYCVLSFKYNCIFELIVAHTANMMNIHKDTTRKRAQTCLKIRVERCKRRLKWRWRLGVETES
jgi:hypothetical protein